MSRAFLAAALALWMPAVVHATAATVLNVWADDPALLDVQIVHADGAAIDGKSGLELGEADRIRTGYKSHARLDFAGKATVVVEELSEFKVGVFKLGQTSQVELWLKAGEVQAQVRKEAAAKTEFAVRTPTATASVRGTKIESILYTKHSGTLIAMGGEGSLHATKHNGPTVQVNHDQNAKEDEERRAFKDDLHLKLEDSRTFVAPQGLDRLEQDVVAFNPLTTTSGVNTVSSGSSLGPLAPSVVGSSLPSLLVVEGTIDPNLAQTLLQFGFNPVVTSNTSTLGGNLAGYVGVLITHGADAFPFLANIQAYHDAGHGVVFDGRGLQATFSSVAIPAYLGGGSLCSAPSTQLFFSTPAAQQITAGAVLVNTALPLQPNSAGPGSSTTLLFPLNANAQALVIDQRTPGSPPSEAAMVFTNDGKGRAAFIGIDLPSSGTGPAVTLARAAVRKAGGLP